MRRGLAGKFSESLELGDLKRFLRDWPVFAGRKQRPPLGDWRTWLLLGGRGAGKTRAGAEWLSRLVRGDRHFQGDAAGRVALVGETHDDARAVMVEGQSGVLAVSAPDFRPKWHPARRELVWPNGVVGKVFSAADPEGLRGSQFGAAWCDEVAKWAHPGETWDMLQFCMRLGRDPRRIATTTPKPIPLLKTLIADRATAVTRAATSENRPHLAPGFIEHLEERYGGTRLGRQELGGEIVEDREDGLWSRSQLEALRRVVPELLARVVVAVDPPSGSGAASVCGIVAAGADGAGRIFVLADRSMPAAAPAQWSAAAIGLYRSLQADCILAEVNQGGEMVRAVIEAADPSLPVRAVRANRGKWLRAEPVAMLYERGRVFHAGRLQALEDEMCAFGPDGSSQGRSPDRLDALVWAVGELAAAAGREPRIRGI